MEYNPKVLDHFTNPRNTGRISRADGIGLVGDPLCGDYLRIYIKVDGEKLAEIIRSLRLAAIATSAFTELARGKLLEEALELSSLDIVEALGGLPENKLHCANLVAEAFSRAVIDYITRPAREYSRDKR